MATTHNPAKIEQLIKVLVGDKKPSGVVEHKLDDRGLELRLFVPRDKLTSTGARDLIGLLMSDMM